MNKKFELKGCLESFTTQTWCQVLAGNHMFLTYKYDTSWCNSHKADTGSFREMDW